jgi:hypothetical protein
MKAMRKSCSKLFIQLLTSCQPVVNQSETKFCSVEIHISSTGSYEKRGCNVDMAFIVPENIENYPWVFLFVKGSHMHPPPPPTKTPQELFQAITTLMRGHNLLTLTRGKLRLTINWLSTG